MPGIATHHVFGREAYPGIAGCVAESETSRQAFLLGNLGPDPFFYLAVAPAWQRFRRIGSRMHAENTSELLDAVHTHLVAAPDATDAMRAYALGFCCHYLLDSTVHPLVYAQQYAICAFGVEGVGFEGPWLHRSVHATIETEIDEYVLTTHLATNPVAYRPHLQMLRCSDAALAEISCGMARALSQAFGLRVPQGIFASAVELNRIGQRLLDSKSGGLRARFDFFPPVGYAVSYARALSPAGAACTFTQLANDDHFPWSHPYIAGAVIDASFDELYAQTLQWAAAVLPAYGAADFGLDACRALTRGINFLGREIE